MKEPLLQFFEYKHLPPRLQMISAPFHDMAHNLCNTIERNPERTMALRKLIRSEEHTSELQSLRKLIEAKDCAVRAAIYKDPPGYIPGT